MEFKQVVAIVRSQVLDKVEDRLVELRVKGIGISRIKGYGEASSFVNPEWEFPYARIEIFCEAGMVEPIVDNILDAAHIGYPGDGIVAVQAVEKLYRIRSKTMIVEDGT